MFDALLDCINVVNRLFDLSDIQTCLSYGLFDKTRETVIFQVTGHIYLLFLPSCLIPLTSLLPSLPASTNRLLSFILPSSTLSDILGLLDVLSAYVDKLQCLLVGSF